MRLAKWKACGARAAGGRDIERENAEHARARRDEQLRKLSLLAVANEEAAEAARLAADAAVPVCEQREAVWRAKVDAERARCERCSPPVQPVVEPAVAETSVLADSDEAADDSEADDGGDIWSVEGEENASPALALAPKFAYFIRSARRGHAP